MPTPSRTAAAVAAVAAAALVVGTTGAPAVASDHKEVDQSLLVPSTLDSSFAPFDCKLKVTGPVCTGERVVHTDWGVFDFPCDDVTVYSRTDSSRQSTRFYDHDYLNYDRRVRIHDVDHLSTSPEGPAQATITTHGRFAEPFAVPGDVSTVTVITTGTIGEIALVGGPPLARVVGTLVEPPDAPGTFTGHSTVDGVTTRWVDAPLDVVFGEEQFVATVCEAVGAG
ncbi:hypothetical protein [Aquipuribacter nitratireducens]|uniref:Uncharacterized protein n=1 Tax=Aquipuribacter nitratireducens TaxID=650104 RepID=A0ABW0GHK4_9MICO